jgi:prepilin-type N-terminal cleavage/methylation domain-containing protein
MMNARRGISLIEVLVAVTLFGMIATVHTAVTLRYAVRNRVAAVGVNRAAALSSAVDLFSTLPFGTLAANVGCATVSTNPAYPHQRCVTATVLTPFVTQLRVVITPTNTAFRPDTAFVNRSAPSSAGPFS